MLNTAGHVVTFDITILSGDSGVELLPIKYFLFRTTRNLLHRDYFFPHRQLTHLEGKTLSLQKVCQTSTTYDIFFFSAFYYDQHSPFCLFRHLLFLYDQSSH